MNKLCTLFGSFCLFVISTSAHAVTFTQDISFTLDPSQISNTPGNTSWRSGTQAMLAPETLSVGDVLILNINFANSQGLRVNADPTPEVFTMGIGSTNPSENLIGVIANSRIGFNWVSGLQTGIQTTFGNVGRVGGLSYTPSDTFNFGLMELAGFQIRFEITNDFIRALPTSFDSWNLMVQGNDALIEIFDIGAAPVPEPSTYILMGLALIGVVSLRKKQLRIHS